MCSCSSDNISLSDEIKVLIYVSLQECLEKCGESLQEIINYHMVSLSALQNVPMCSTQVWVRWSSKTASSGVSVGADIYGPVRVHVPFRAVRRVELSRVNWFPSHITRPACRVPVTVSTVPASQSWITSKKSALQAVRKISFSQKL